MFLFAFVSGFLIAIVIGMLLVHLLAVDAEQVIFFIPGGGRE